MPRKRKKLITVLESLGFSPKSNVDQPLKKPKVKTKFTIHKNMRRLHKVEFTNHERVVRHRARQQGLSVSEYEEKWAQTY